MNIEKYLILLRDKDGKFRDRSKDIETYKDYGKIIKVKFYNNENLYTYTKNNFKIFTNPLNIENKIGQTNPKIEKIQQIQESLQRVIKNKLNEVARNLGNTRGY